VLRARYTAAAEMMVRAATDDDQQPPFWYATVVGNRTGWRVHSHGSPLCQEVVARAGLGNPNSWRPWRGQQRLVKPRHWLRDGVNESPFVLKRALGRADAERHSALVAAAGNNGGGRRFRRHPT
jgi:hypothetical protein